MICVRRAESESIVYVSASVPQMTPLLLEGLLVEAYRLNAESGVTGALIYSDGMFGHRAPAVADLRPQPMETCQSAMQLAIAAARPSVCLGNLSPA